MLFFYLQTVFNDANEKEDKLTSIEIEKIEELYYLILEHIHNPSFRFVPDISVQLVSNSLVHYRGMEPDKIKMAIMQMAMLDHGVLPKDVIKEWQGHSGHCCGKCKCGE